MDEKLLERLYESYSLPSGLGGVDRLYEAAKIIDGKITRRDVSEFLRGKDSYTMHKVTLKRFPRRKMLAPRPRVILSSDLADMRELSKYNNGYNYLLICIDIFSRLLDVAPIKRKNSKNLLAAMKKVLERPEFQGVSRLLTDRGSEFYNKPVRDYLEKKNIKLYSVSSYEIKAAIAERVIRTLKSKIYKYLTSRNTLKYIDALGGLVTSYNTSKHRGLGGKLTPLEVHHMKDRNEINALFSKMYKSGGEVGTRLSKELEIGQTVRISDSDRYSKFKRGYKTQNTAEIFKIYKVDKKHSPTVYYIEDLAGEKIDGIFYRQELTPTALPSVFPIDVIKKKKVNGRYIYLVSWRGYPQSFNSWIEADDIKQI